MPNKKAHLLKKLSLKSRLVLAAVVWLTAMIIAAGVMVPSQVYVYMEDDAKHNWQLTWTRLPRPLKRTRKAM